MFYLGLYGGKCEKNFLSETTRPRTLIFGIQHHLVDLYQVCSNYTPGAKNGPAPSNNLTPGAGPFLAPGVKLFDIGLYRENVKKSSCLKPQGLEP